MPASKDLLLDIDFDLQTAGGDFAVGDSDAQHIELILLTGPGHWRQTPLLGFNITQYLNGPDQVNRDKFERDLKVQLEDIDGYQVKSIDTTNGYHNVSVAAVRT